MPEYLYTCDCGYTENVRHGITEEIVVECSHCNKWMRRKPQLGAVTFKGDGWAGKDK